MSNDKGSAALVNVVKPTSNRSSASQGLENDNRTLSTNSSFLAPDTPPALLAALSKEIEPIDQFTEPFGTVNKYGETILFDLPRQVCIVEANKRRVERVSNGKVAIIFYPEQGRVLMIVNKNDSFWPVVRKVFLKNTSGTYTQEFITYVCTAAPGIGDHILDVGENTHETRVYVVEVEDLRYVTFCNKKYHDQFKNVIRNVQSRISKNRLPTNDIPKKEGALAVSEFWFQSGLRPRDLKLLFLHETDISNSTYFEFKKHGFVAIGQYKANKSLQLIIVTEYIKNHCEVSEDFTLIASDVSSDTNTFVWEWFVNCNERNACGFKTAKEASNFKTIIDYYLDAWKKKSLSWDW